MSDVYLFRARSAGASDVADPKAPALLDAAGTCVMPTSGVFCRVITGGVIRPGDPLESV